MNKTKRKCDIFGIVTKKVKKHTKTIVKTMKKR